MHCACLLLIYDTPHMLRIVFNSVVVEVIIFFVSFSNENLYFLYIFGIGGLFILYIVSDGHMLCFHIQSERKFSFIRIEFGLDDL